MFEWYSIPGVTIAAFIYLGFVAAGEELEQPFGYDSNDLDLDFFCKEVIRVDISRVKRSPCSNAWFSRRWKERIMKEELKDEERWKSPLGIRKGIVNSESPGHDLTTNGTVTPGPPLAGERHSTHIGRMRSKTITEAIGSTIPGKDGANGKGKMVEEEESSDSEFDGSDDPISSSEGEHGRGDSDDWEGESDSQESVSPRGVTVV
ncbi:hypothetical protein PM082_007653 [Marasmius tenuissimus]|nr:hypothetical protein PM082_007653 [Marasmius tenuissimus]